jgi:hypothetical protein
MFNNTSWFSKKKKKKRLPQWVFSISTLLSFRLLEVISHWYAICIGVVRLYLERIYSWSHGDSHRAVAPVKKKARYILISGEICKEGRFSVTFLCTVVNICAACFESMHNIYVFRTVSLNSINRLAFIMKPQQVYCEVRTNSYILLRWTSGFEAKDLYTAKGRTFSNTL